MAPSSLQSELLAQIDDFIVFISCVEGLSPETVRAYGQHLEAYADWCESHAVDGLDPSSRDLRSYLAEFRRDGRASTTVAAHLSALRSFFRWLEYSGHRAGAVPLATVAPKQRRELPHVLTAEELAALFDAPDLSCPVGLRDAAMLELFIATGARASPSFPGSSSAMSAWLRDKCAFWAKAPRSESSPYTRGRSRFTRGILKTEGPICFGRPRSAATRAVRCSSPTGEGR